MYELTEILKIKLGIAAVSDAGNPAEDGPVFYDSIAYDRFIGIVNCGIITAGQSIVVQLLQASDTTGTGVKVLGSSATFLAAGAVVTGVAQCDARAEELDTANGFRYVGIRLTATESDKVAGAVIGFGMAKHEPAVQ